MTEEALDMEIEPDLLAVDERAVSEESNKPPSPEPTSIEEPSTSAPMPSTSSSTSVAASTSSQTIVGNHPTKQQFDVFLHNLTNCVNKELIDSAAIEFLLNLNTKNNRKKLTNALFGVQR